MLRGRNSLSLSAADSGTWVITLQLARRRTQEQVGRDTVHWQLQAGPVLPASSCWSLRLAPHCKHSSVPIVIQCPSNVRSRA